jgi:hypothetical protein
MTNLDLDHFAVFGKTEAIFKAIVATVLEIVIIVVTINKKLREKMKVPLVFRFIILALMVYSWIQLALVLSYRSFAVYTALN